MTTVYVDKRLGIAITDSRVTTTTSRFFAGFFPLTPHVSRGVTTQKAIYIHDRLFLGTGNVGTIDKIIKYLCGEPKPTNFDKKESCECLLIGKEYGVQFIVFNNKIRQKTFFIPGSWQYYMGSGSTILEELLPRNKYHTHEEVFEKFREITEHDVYTDTNINLYKI